MSRAQQLITENIATWTGAIQAKSTAGRGSSNKYELYGIKKLRELILDLAVRGKLVPQDPNDEPASVLLERIAAEKAELIKAKKIKKPKALPPISDEEKPFELPEGWEWSRLETIAPMSVFDGDWIESKDQDENGEVRLLQLADIGVNEFKNASSKFINEDTFERLNCSEVKENDILIARLPSPIGRACLFPSTNQKAIAAVDIAIVRTLGLLSNQYVVHAVNSNIFREQVEAFGKGATRFRISTGNLKSLLVPAPPLAEQQRIVQKVDELMTLCDQLEQQTESRIEAHATLVDTLLSTLTNSADADELQQNWARIAGHFDILFTTERSIDALKQTILQLAVMGKLVRQNPEDEPASVLLDKIATEKAILIKEKKIKKQKPLPPINDDEKPFELPQGWEWSRVGEFAYVFAGNSFKSGDFNTESGIKVIKITNAGVGEFVETDDYLPRDFSEQFEPYIVNQGDLILALTRPYISAGLKISICPASYHKSLLNQRVAAIRHISETDYLYLFLRSPVVLNHYQTRFGGSGLQPNLKMSDVLELCIAIPPLSEQHRIATKVDKLMSICDQLKDKLQQSRQTQVHLTNALIDQALI